MSRVVVALGGHALIHPDRPGSADARRRDLELAADALVALIDQGHEVVLTYGDGPDAILAPSGPDAVRGSVAAPSLDGLVDGSEGAIGYLIVRALADRLARDGRRPAIALLPIRSVDSRRIAALVAAGVIVVASGGGDIQQQQSAAERLDGVEAAVDQDLAAVELAVGIDADALLLLTDVPAAYLGWGRPTAIPLRRITIDGARAGIANGTFAARTMGAKLAAAAVFVERTGRYAAIGALQEAVAVLDGRAGTTIMEDRVVDHPARPTRAAVA